MQNNQKGITHNAFYKPENFGNQKNLAGIVHNAFYKKNNRNSTQNTFWGRTQNQNTEIFEYRENEEGKIIIIEKK